MKRIAISILKNFFLCNGFSLVLEDCKTREKNGQVLMCTLRTPYPVCGLWPTGQPCSNTTRQAASSSNAQTSQTEPFNSERGTQTGVLKPLKRNLGVYSELFTGSKARCFSARCAFVALLEVVSSCEAFLFLSFASGFFGLLFAWTAAGGFGEALY